MTAAPNTTVPRPPRRWFKWVVRGVVFVGTLPFWLPALYLAAQLWAGWNVDREWARIRAAGEPTSIEDLQAMADSAGYDELITAAWQEILSLPEIESLNQDLEYLPIREFRFWESSISVEDELTLRRKVLAKYSVLIDKLRGLRALPGRPRWNLQLDESRICLDDKALNSLRNCVTLTIHQTIDDVHSDDHANAVSDIILALRFIEWIENLPTNIGLLVRASAFGRCTSALEMILRHHILSSPEMELLSAQIVSPTSAQHLRRSIWGDRVLMSNLVHETFAEADDIPGWIARTSVHSGHLHVLAQIREILEVIDSPRSERDQLLREHEKHQQSSQGLFSRLPAKQLEELIAPAYDPLMSRVDQAATLSQMVQVSLAIERYRLANGELPKALSAMVPDYLPEVPPDRLGDGPLRYLRDGDKWMVYSVGTNGRDDRGGRNEYGELDMTIRVGYDNSPLIESEEESEVEVTASGK